MSRPWVGVHGELRASPDVRIEHLRGPNPLWGSNGIAFGPDGRLYVAQFVGGVVGALDLDTGRLDVVLGPDGPLTAPDDLAFADDGTMYVVDLPPGLVWRRRPDGETSVVAEGITAPDGIACHRGRLFVNELHPDGRLLEIDLDGGPPRVMATGLVMGNAMQVGPDGRLYYPHLMGGEVWRVDLDGGEPERLLTGLDRPVAVRFDRAGRLLVLSNNAHGGLAVLDLATGTRRDVETGIVGQDNLAVAPDGRTFVSSAFGGGLYELLDDDGTTSTVLQPGLHGPQGIAATAGKAGSLLVADHFTVADVAPDGTLRRLGDPGATSPVGVRGATVHAGELHVTTVRGEVHVGDPRRGMRRRASGLTGPTGLTGAPDGGLLVADTAAGRLVHLDGSDRSTVVADDLGAPVDVAVVDHDVHVTDVEGGRILRLRDRAVVASGLGRPEGLAALGGVLWCLDAEGGRLLRVDPASGAVHVEVSGLPLAVAPDHLATQEGGLAAHRPTPFAALEPVGDALVVGLTGTGGLLTVTPT